MAKIKTEQLGTSLPLLQPHCPHLGLSGLPTRSLQTPPGAAGSSGSIQGPNTWPFPPPYSPSRSLPPPSPLACFRPCLLPPLLSLRSFPLLPLQAPARPHHVCPGCEPQDRRPADALPAMPTWQTQRVLRSGSWMEGARVSHWSPRCLVS